MILTMACTVYSTIFDRCYIKLIKNISLSCKTNGYSNRINHLGRARKEEKKTVQKNLWFIPHTVPVQNDLSLVFLLFEFALFLADDLKKIYQHHPKIAAQIRTNRINCK